MPLCGPRLLYSSLGKQVDFSFSSAENEPRAFFFLLPCLPPPGFFICFCSLFKFTVFFSPRLGLGDHVIDIDISFSFIVGSESWLAPTSPRLRPKASPSALLSDMVSPFLSGHLDYINRKDLASIPCPPTSPRLRPKASPSALLSDMVSPFLSGHLDYINRKDLASIPCPPVLSTRTSIFKSFS